MNKCECNECIVCELSAEVEVQETMITDLRAENAELKRELKNHIDLNGGYIEQLAQAEAVQRVLARTTPPAYMSVDEKIKWAKEQAEGK